MPSGNTSHTHGSPEFRFRSMEEQKARAVVGVMVGWPAVEVEYGEQPQYPLEDVTVDVVCLRPGTSGEETERASGSDAKEGPRGHWADL